MWQGTLENREDLAGVVEISMNAPCISASFFSTMRTKLYAHLQAHHKHLF